MTPAEVGAVVVAWNAGHLLARTVDTLLANGTGLVVVVDNASSDDSVGALRPDDRVVVVTSPTNLGYGGGANLGAQALPASIGAVLICNSDLAFEPDSVARLSQRLGDEPDLGLVGPGLLDLDGERYPSGRRFPSMARDLGHGALAPVWPGNPLTRAYRQAGWDRTTPRDVDWVSGACMLVRRTAWEAVGGFDDRYFMFLEDVDLCARVGAAGWRVAYEPTSLVVHEVGASRARVPNKMLVAHHRSMLRWAGRDLHGLRTVALAPTAALLGASLAFRVSVAAVRGTPDGARTDLGAAVVPLAVGPTLDRVGVVILTYGSEDDIGPCLASLLDASIRPLEVVVVDNASDDGTVEAAAAAAAALPDRIDVTIVSSPANDGFSAGANRGLAALLQQPEPPSVVAVLNPDARCRPGALDALAEALTDPTVGLAAARQVGDDDRPLPIVEEDYRLRRVIASTLRLGAPLRPVAPIEPLPGDDPPPVDVGWVHGGLLATTAAALDRLGGGFDERFFLYAEDLELAMRTHRRGLRVVVVPDAVIQHEGGASARRSDGDAGTAARRVTALAAYLSGAGGTSSFRRATYAASVLLAHGPMSLVELVRAGGSGRQSPSIHTAMSRAALRALRSPLPGPPRPGRVR